jgi:peptidyl-prolyl cis-trans isomerase B (cyclophilin B)
MLCKDASTTVRPALIAAAAFCLSIAPGCGQSSTTGTDATSAANRAGATDAKSPLVELKTSLGVLKLQLDVEHSPETVENFLAYVERGHYNGTIFHQVEKGYALLGGGYLPDLSERQGRYSIRNEATNGLKNKRGTIAMARYLDAINSATCHFVINLVDNPSLDHYGDSPEEYGFCVFGHVVEGLEVLDQIAEVPTRSTEQFSALPVQAVVIEQATRLR